MNLKLDLDQTLLKSSVSKETANEERTNSHDL